MGKISLSKFRIVTAAYPMITESNFAAELQQYLSQNGYHLEITTELAPESKHEIYVGFSNASRCHPQCHDFEVSVKNGKIYMAAGDMFGYDAMREYVRTEFFKPGEQYTFDAEMDFSYHGNGNALATNLLLCRGEDVRVIRLGFGDAPFTFERDDLKNTALNSFLDHRLQLIALGKCLEQMNLHRRLVLIFV